MGTNLNSPNAPEVDPRWISSGRSIIGLHVWWWHEENGDFTYHMTFDPPTQEFRLIVDHLGAERPREMGPFSKASTPTEKVLAHIAGEEI